MDEIVDDIEAPENLSALVAATREALLRTHYTERSLKVFERVWRDLEFEWPVDAAEPFTREYGLAFLARRYGLALCEGQRPKAGLDQHRLRAIELLLDMQAHHPFANRRRRTPVTFTGPWATIFEAFVTFEKQVGRAARTMESHITYLTRFAEFLQVTGVEAPQALDSRVLTSSYGSLVNTFP